MDQQFIVLEQLHHSIILGLDFMTSKGVKIDFHQKLLFVDEIVCVNLLSDSKFGYARCRKTEVIPAESESVISVRITDGCKNGTVLLEPSEGLKNTMLFGARCLVEVKNKKSVMRIVNPTKKDIALSPKRIIGYVNIVDCDEVFPFDDDCAELNGIAYVQSAENKSKLSNVPQKNLNFDIDGKNLSCEQKDKLKNFLNKNSDVFSTSFSDIGKTDIFLHKIETEPGAKPVRMNFYRQDPIKKAETERQTNEMLKDGLIERSTSVWNSPVVLVKKKDDSWRFAVDYRKLNQVTIPISQPLPRIEDVFDALGESKAKIFSTLDLNSAYFQIALDPETRHKAAFVTHEGVFEFTRMPFGLKNAPMSFQMLMSIVLKGLNWKFVLCYIDDILVFSPDFETHLQHLDQVFQRLREAKLTLKPSKCSFAVDKVVFLGHILSETGVEVDPEKTEKVRNFPIPKSQKELRSFLGLCNFYRRFVKDYSKICIPLNSLLKKDVRKQFSKTDWSDDCQKAFERLKQALVSTPILRFPDMNKPFVLSTDASGSAIGYILGQKDENGLEYVVSYGGRALRVDEKKWTTCDLECLAVVEGIESFKHYLTLQQFDLYTDHAALTALRNKTEPKGRLGRWCIKLQSYNFNIHHRKGVLNKNADALSRLDYSRLKEQPNSQNAHVGSLTASHVKNSKSTQSNENVVKVVSDSCPSKQTDSIVKEDSPSDFQTLQTFIEYESPCVCPVTTVSDDDIAKLQRVDTFCKELIDVLENQNFPADEKKAYNLGFYSNEFVMRDGVLYHWFTPRVKTPKDVKLIDPDKILLQLVVPKCLRQDVLSSYHDCLAGGGHLGEKKTWAALRLKYYWPKMHEETIQYIKSCDKCQKSKTNRNRRPVPLTPIPVGEPFERIHVDILCSLPKTKDGFQYILLVVDSCTKWVEGFPLRTQEAKEIADILFKEIICRCGAPSYIVSDRGRNFMSKLISALCELFSITRHHTSSYHPQTNSTVERTNSVLAQALRTQLDKDQKDWANLLPCALMALRSKPCTESTGYSPFQMMFGREMVLPIDTSLIPRPSMQLSAQEYFNQLIARLKLVTADAKSKQETHQQKSKVRHDQKAKVPEFEEGDLVLVKQEKVDTGLSAKLAEKWVGPYEIIEVGPNYTYKVKNMENNKVTKSMINAARLKKYHQRLEPESEDSDDENEAPQNQPLIDQQQDTQANNNDKHDVADSQENDNKDDDKKDTGSSQDKTAEADKQDPTNQENKTKPDTVQQKDIGRIISATQSNGQWYRVLFKNGGKLWLRESHIPNEFITEYLKTRTKQGKARKRNRKRKFFLQKSD